MDKDGAIAELNRRNIFGRLSKRDAHFANVNARKPVWWLDIPIAEIFDERVPTLNIVLADTNGAVHHLSVPNDWLIENLDECAVRPDKDVVSLELSAMPHSQFRDERPRSGRLNFAQFLVK